LSGVHFRTILLAIGAAAALAGCGSAARPEPQIHLDLSAPSDGSVVTSGSVTLSGTVSPVGARVLVLGRRVAVTRGSFTTQVALQPGSNLLDVLAGAAHDRAAMTAVRAYRQILVTIPDVSNDSPPNAAEALVALGLHVKLKDTDPFYAFLIPGGQGVCGTSPSAGHRVDPGATVTISVSKTC
jgi:PASTA domain/Glucodextranase, domain B